MTFPGIASLIRQRPTAPTPESRVLSGVLDEIWDRVSRSVDRSQPYVIGLTSRRIRRTWRGKRFSYAAAPTLTVTNVVTYQLR